MKKMVLPLVTTVLIVILASCSLNVSPDIENGEISNSVVYGKFNGYEILEHRLLVGYEDRNAVEKLVEKLGGEIYLEIPQIKVVAIEIPMEVRKAMRILKALKIEGIRYVEPSYKRDLIDPKPSKWEGEFLRSTRADSIEEEFWKELWGLQKVNAPTAWEEATGVGVVVAVVDTPIDCQHPDLEGQCVEGFDPVLGITIPATADYEDPLNSGDDHGTHVAGIIAAKRDGKGVVGLAYGAKIMSIVIFRGTSDHKGYYYVGDEYVAAGIVWAVDHGADVLSNSWGGGGYSYTLKSAVDYALSHGVVFIAAAGNDHTDQHTHYPSAYPGVIAVAASTARDTVVDFSSRGDYISVAAPGVNIISTIPHLAKYGIYGKPYDYWGGTSMATPHVSALVALIKQKHPEATPYQIRRMIENSAVDIEEPGWDHAAGYGRIDAHAALQGDPAAYSGSTYRIKVISEGGKTGIPAVLVSLKRRSGEGPDYYASTDEKGVASFYGIDPAEYEVIVGGPDLYEINSPVLRMEEETSTTFSVNLASGTSEGVVVFDTEISFEFDLPKGHAVSLLGAGALYTLGKDVPIWTFTATESTSVSYVLESGQAVVFYSIPEPATTDTTITATVVINGSTPTAIYGVIPMGATSTFLDDWGGLGFWYTAF